MLVTDKDLIKFKVATKVIDLLKDAGIIVAVGGGSAIDTSKAIAIIMTNPEFAVSVVTLTKIRTTVAKANAPNRSCYSKFFQQHRERRLEIYRSIF